ncbi:snapalysin family zinc-dependent metalloprotease [Streptomyces thermocarboxydus]|uniref:snapalysin family zinc-dependent metalloprotease n=1 Tax=Streptomyces TaxID=1883 RepID=UPI0020C5B6AA|nr:snapalysin family zinc-dependent metalloprotease [Streptomyces sp. AC04842]MDN3290160.1 snapalysin family zinc-dependent metalloprotease [Streptomyces thermocarboxydus]
MRIRTLAGAVAAVFVLSSPVVGGQAVAVRTAGTAAPSGETQVLTYDTGRAGEFASAVDRGAAIWNNSLDAVELRRAAAGETADIRIVVVDGWPRTVPGGLGSGTVYFGREAVAEGHSTVRIAAHELGHVLGLPDRKPGPCSELMSGASAGPSCRSTLPNAAERAEVEEKFERAPAGLFM